jgi:hypothetical protein
VNETPPRILGVSKSKEKLSRVILFSVAIIIAGVVGFKYLFSIPPSDVVQADDGFKKAKGTIDPEKLRVWALEEIAKHKPSTNDYEVKDIPNSEIPDCIQNLYPCPAEDATVQIDEDQRYVMIVWGGGFFHWKIDVGSTNLTGAMGSGNHFTTIEWAPGIYYSREDTRHPFK